MNTLLLFLFDIARAEGTNDRLSVTKPTDSHGLPSISGAGDSTSAALINRVLKAVINLSLGFIATFAVAGVMWGGFLILKGGEEGMKTGKKAITMSLLGLLIAIMAYSIVSLVIGFNPLETLGLMGESPEPE